MNSGQTLLCLKLWMHNLTMQCNLLRVFLLLAIQVASGMSVEEVFANDISSGGTPSPGFSPQRQANRKSDRGGKSHRNRAEVVRQDGREEGVVNEGKLPQGACAPLSEMEQVGSLVSSFPTMLMR